MSRSLITSFYMTLLNPTKRELNMMANLLTVSTPVTKPIVQYTILNNSDLIRMNAIHGRSNNMRIISYLAACEYNTFDLNVSEVLKPLS
jgi:hypothetical protein